jgi:aldehyde:ferredoxin oxidoreductase
VDTLREQGALGRGCDIDTDIPVDEIGELHFVEELLHSIAYRRGIGDDLAEGLPRAAARWGRLERDLATGDLPAPFWGYPIHYDPRTEVYWGYASLVTSRDVNCHDFNVAAFWMPTLDIMNDREPLLSAAEVAQIVADKAIPYCDPRMLDFSEGNLYSTPMAKTTAWLLHYSLFWKQSCGLCDNAFADFINPYGPDNRGLTPEGELRFWETVTGRPLDFPRSLEQGRRILNLDRGIWVLQGRHRDQEIFPDFIYDTDARGTSYVPGKDPAYYCPVQENGEWTYKNVVPRHLDREKVEDWKTVFYELEGWDPATGWPTEDTLSDLSLDGLAGELAKKDRLA